MVHLSKDPPPGEAGAVSSNASSLLLITTGVSGGFGLRVCGYPIIWTWRKWSFFSLEKDLLVSIPHTLINSQMPDFYIK